jgi:hypothetical protein
MKFMKIFILQVVRFVFCCITLHKGKQIACVKYFLIWKFKYLYNSHVFEDKRCIKKKS